jgi:hypothetical protein
MTTLKTVFKISLYGLAEQNYYARIEIMMKNDEKWKHIRFILFDARARNTIAM